MVEIDDVKNSLRVDHSLDDKLLEQLIATAESYVVHAVDSQLGAEDFKDYQQFDWAVSLLVQHWYVNQQISNVEHIPFTVTSLIQQLRGSVWHADSE
ncbi:MAG: head-tail connector protein [Tetragenococcus koreensis]|nr:head-tail connector protein [Tetragenococcus koreensis]